MAKGTVNKVILIGRLGADPELKYTPSGVAVTNFNIATDRAFKDKDGNWQNEAEWHRIVLWRDLAERANEYVKKGHRIYIEGSLRTRSWEDKDGVKRYTTEVWAQSMEYLESRDSASGGAFPPAPSDEDLPASPGSGSGNADNASGDLAASEDDLPF